jgi:hypothetical protein
MTTKAQAIVKGWLNEDGTIAARGNLPLVEPVKKPENTERADVKDWRKKVNVSVSRDERKNPAQPDAPAIEPPKGIPEDTLRRLRYAAFETIHEDGSRTFKHDPRIESDTHIPLNGK